jgi:predicted permease
MTVVLLCGAALLVRTVTALTSVNHGFEQQGLLTLQVSLPGTRYPIERQVAFQQELLMAIRELPGVDSAGAASSLPVIGAPRAGTRFHRLSTPVVPPTQMSSATIRVVTPGYFRTLRIPVLRGREFAHADDTNPAPGFIVNQEFVDRYLPNVDPLRESLMVRMRDENPYAPIIGVVGNVGEGSMRSAPRPTIFYNHSQLPLGPTLLVRTDRAVATAEAVTSVIRRMDPNLVIRNVRTFEEAVAESLAQERLTALVSGGFAVSALLLASLGVYALLAFMVSERRREIGLRMALGADGGALIRSVVARGLRLVAIGSAVGVAFSLVALPSLRTLLFGVTPNDSETYALVLSLLMLVSGVASYLPARHAARVEPLVALRQD